MTLVGWQYFDSSSSFALMGATTDKTGRSLNQNSVFFFNTKGEDVDMRHRFVSVSVMIMVFGISESGFIT